MDLAGLVDCVEAACRMRETGMRCVKYFLFLMNLLFSVAGCVLIVSGVVIGVAYTQYLDFLGNSFLSTPLFLILLGLTVFFIAFFGCCGAINEHHCCTLTYSWVLGTLFLLELGAAFMLYGHHRQVGALVADSMEEAMTNFNRPGHKGVTETWNVMQHELSCCGVDSYRDWVNTTFSSRSRSVPDSCCLADVVGCGRGILNLPPHQAALKIHGTGCLSVLSVQASHNITALAALIVGIVFLQFVGLLFSFCLANSIKKECEIV